MWNFEFSSIQSAEDHLGWLGYTRLRRIPGKPYAVSVWIDPQRKEWGYVLAVCLETDTFPQVDFFLLPEEAASFAIKDEMSTRVQARLHHTLSVSCRNRLQAFSNLIFLARGK